MTDNKLLGTQPNKKCVVRLLKLQTSHGFYENVSTLCEHPFGQRWQKEEPPYEVSTFEIIYVSCARNISHSATLNVTFGLCKLSTS